MLKIYHAPGTRGFRAIWLCEELQLRYEVVPVNMSPEYRESPEWRRMNPVGKVPVLAEDGFHFYESGAMVQHLLNKFGNGRLQPPPGKSEHAIYLQWSWFAEATFARPLGEIVNHRRAFPNDTIPGIVDEMKDRARLCAQALDATLQQKLFLCGNDFTAADIMMGYTLLIYGHLMEEPMPGHVERYWKSLTERPAFQATEIANRAS